MSKHDQQAVDPGGRLIWSRGTAGGHSVYLDKVDVTDPYIHAHKPYRLTTATVGPAPLIVVELHLGDLRDLHRQLTDELARVATRGRWPGQSRQGRR